MSFFMLIQTEMKNKQAREDREDNLIVVNYQIKHGVALMQEYSEVLTKTSASLCKSFSNAAGYTWKAVIHLKV